tara:strand:+ start:4412 stop:5746 length:1335 start_codon:yes stop_codon:yes gene_type:complete
MNKTMTSSDSTINGALSMSDEHDASKFNRKDLAWALSLFGTAVGAGILFLPINAGLGGFWPLIFTTLLIGPMTYFSHRGLTRFVLSSKQENADIIDVVEEHFGRSASHVVAILYFFVFYPILLIYGSSITNTVDSFLINQLGWVQTSQGQEVTGIIPRWLLSLVLITMMVLIMTKSRELMLKITSYLVYPLVVILFCLSIYLIPNWNMTAMSMENVPDVGSFFSVIWMTLPVLVFSFNHSPAISEFALVQRKNYKDQAMHKADKVLRLTTAALLAFIMFFVFSCVMSLSPAQILEAKSQNVSVLTYLANSHDSYFISLFGPMIAIIAIMSSFFGHYLGANEGIKGFILRGYQAKNKQVCEKSLNLKISLFMILSIWAVALLNPSILGMIESLGGPIIAALLYLMPMYATYKVPALKKYRGYVSNIFVIVMGLLATTAILYKLLG